MFLSHMILAFLWTIYCFLHSLLAGKQIKKKSQQLLGTSFKYYRLFYTLFAFLFFLALLYYQISIATVEVFEPRIIVETAGYILGGLGLLIMLYCIKKYFLGLSGVMSLVREEHPTGLFISGIHNYVRHPLYLGTFSFIWGLFLIMPHLSLLVANIIITVYTLVGIEMEEQKLIAEFGEAYKIYQKKVPKLIPFSKFKQQF